MPRVAPPGGWKSGVYLIRNRVNGKVYVGSSVDIKGRWYDHIQSLLKGKHRNRHLQAAWFKYGGEVFEFVVIEHCQPSFCIRLEQKWMDHYKAADPELGYNISPTAGSSLGMRMLEETKAKQSEYALDRPAEHRKNLSAAAKRKRLVEEHKTKIGVGVVAAFQADPTNRQRAAASVRGQKRSAETKMRISAAMKGRTVSEETRAKIRASLTGRKLSTETRAKLSVAGRRFQASLKAERRV